MDPSLRADRTFLLPEAKHRLVFLRRGVFSVGDELSGGSWTHCHVLPIVLRMRIYVYMFVS